MKIYKDVRNDEYFIDLLNDEKEVAKKDGLIFTKNKTIKQYSAYGWQLKEMYKEQELYELAFGNASVLFEIKEEIEKIKQRLLRNQSKKKKISSTDFLMLMLEKEWNEYVEEINQLMGV